MGATLGLDVRLLGRKEGVDAIARMGRVAA